MFSLCKNSNKSFLSFTSSLLRNAECRGYATKKSKVSIILTQEIPKVGQKGEELEVSKGYARNFFFMRNLAVRATHENRKLYEEFSKNINYSARKEEKQNSKAIKSIKADGKILVMRSALSNGEPSVTITADNISYSLKRRRRIDIEPKNIIIENPINSFGEHNITILFGSTEIPATLVYNSL